MPHGTHAELKDYMKACQNHLQKGQSPQSALLQQPNPLAAGRKMKLKGNNDFKDRKMRETFEEVMVGVFAAARKEV
ncbi:unnamed protein product [Prunus armeniaca]